MYKIPYFRQSFLLNIVSGIESTVTTHSILGALIQENTAIYNISFNYMAKDVVSNIGSLAVINKMSNMSDVKPMKTVYMSQGAYQCSLVAECVANYFPSFMIIPVLGLAGVGKTMSWTTIGAINAKYISKTNPNHVGENYAKLSICNTIANSIGTGVGLVIVQHPSHLLAIPFLTLARIQLLKQMTQTMTQTYFDDSSDDSDSDGK